MHKDRNITKNKKDKIIRGNEKRTSMLIDVAILGESVIYKFPVKVYNIIK